MTYKSESPRWDDAGLIQHFKFCATMQLRTPLRVLQHHNDTHWDREQEPPKIAVKPWQGIWVPCTRLSGLFEYEATMASEVGQIPVSGGDFLRFLLTIREAVESRDTGKHAAALAVATSKTWEDIVEKLGGAHSVAMKLCKAKAG
ncbi:hypothetical protein [Pseudomonas sp. O11]|uniref:hypothetical protein n=1 Tax=Pseudomonas sp. O11 TaxID=3159446 RepID=UPI00387B8E9C